MNFETINAGTRRVVGWVLKAAAAVVTFAVVFRVTTWFDRWHTSITSQANGALSAAIFVWLVKGHIPFYFQWRRAALVAQLDRFPLGSPELTAAALRHFRRRSRVLALPSAFLVALAGYRLVSAFSDSKSHGLLTVLVLLFVLLDGAMGLRREMARLRTLAEAEPSDGPEAWSVARSFARDGASTSADPVSRAIWRRIGGDTPAPAAGSPEASVSPA